MNGITYKSAGVDIQKADEFLDKAKEHIGRTFTPGVLTGIGHFGAFYELDLSGMNEPVLVASTDGVGTKLKVAQMAGNHSTIGQDLLNHCVNDILCAGAKPLFFMDYLAMGRLTEETALQIIRGICAAAQENNVAVIGGETAEMPGVYQPSEYDLAGTIIGMVDKSQIVNGSRISAGDVIIALPSNGLHTNGYSLARKICFDLHKFKIDDYISELDCDIGEELLKIHRSYLKPISELRRSVDIEGLAHITGGGIIGNIKRIIPSGLKAKIEWESWETPIVFRLLKKWGNVSDDEMRKTFNLGIGFTVIVTKSNTESALETLSQAGERPFVIGSIE